MAMAKVQGDSKGTADRSSATVRHGRTDVLKLLESQQCFKGSKGHQLMCLL